MQFASSSDRALRDWSSFKPIRMAGIDSTGAASRKRDEVYYFAARAWKVELYYFSVHEFGGRLHALFPMVLLPFGPSGADQAGTAAAKADGSI